MNTKELLSSKPILCNNFVTQDNLKIIYKIINEALQKGESEGNKYKYFFINDNGMHRFLFLPSHNKGYNIEPTILDDLIRQLQEQISNFLGKEVINISGYFGRYCKDSGFIPQLKPHIDEANFGELYRMSLTSRLKSTIEWDVGVEKERWELKENSALFFSANLYQHWRPFHINFNDTDYYDIMVLHFDFKDVEPWFIDQEYFDKKNGIMSTKSDKIWYDNTKQ